MTWSDPHFGNSAQVAMNQRRGGQRRGGKLVGNSLPANKAGQAAGTRAT